VIGLPETLRPALGSTASAVIYGRDGRVTAHLRQLSDAADPVTRTFEARFVLDGAAAQAPLGASVTLYLAGKADSNVAVPLGALDDEGKGPGVWVFDERESTVSWHAVEVSSVSAENAVIGKGLPAGQRIVALGGHFLHEGQKVRTASVAVALK
jgi:hypothetical protein